LPGASCGKGVRSYSSLRPVYVICGRRGAALGPSGTI
jgi:hypothetical protein